jgi:hypothetical protein
VKYLGIPLTVGRLLALALQPLIDSIADRLPLWKAGMMTKAGRLALVKSVLMAIPLHQIVVLGLNKEALKQIEKRSCEASSGRAEQMLMAAIAM